MAGSRPDRRPALSPALRDALFERALALVQHPSGLVEGAQRQCALSSAIAVEAADLLGHADPNVAHGVRTHLEALPDMGAAFTEAAAAVVSSQWERPGGVVEDVVRDRFGSVAMIEGSAKLVAHALVSQPRLAVLHDDLVRPSPVEAALLLRALAPSTAVIVVSDHPLVIDDAVKVGVMTCSTTIEAPQLERLLDRIVA